MTSTRGHKMLKALEASYRQHSHTPEAHAYADTKVQLSQRLHHILYTEWDPCGIHPLERSIDCSNEYARYLPTIVDMVMDGASVAELTEQLLVYDTYVWGDMAIRRRCEVIAVMVAHYGPHAARQPFNVVVNTATPQAAYQSVLDLVTQTRLDEYQGRWSQSCAAYERVVAICQQHLPERHQLLGACLNNLGLAYSKLRRLEQAALLYSQALPELEHGVHQDYRLFRNFMYCIKNVVNNLEHRRQFAATVPFLEWKLRLHVVEDGWQDGRTWDAKKKLEASSNTRRPAPALHPMRLNVERDGCTRIGQSVCLD